MQVFLKGQSNPVTLDQVECDDDVAVIGTTPSGKRFVAPRAAVGEPLPARHPYRVYIAADTALRVVDPEFAEAEAWLLGEGDAVRRFVRADGRYVDLDRSEVLSILSARPDDEEFARIAAMNAATENEHPVPDGE